MKVEFASVTRRFMLISCCFSMLAGNGFCGECAQSSQHPEWLWCDDFEGGKALKENYQDIDTTGFSISSKDFFDGTHSLQQYYKPGQVDAGWIVRLKNAGFPEHLFMRWYHKFESGFEGFPPKMARMRFRNQTGDWSAPLEIHCWIEDGSVVADVKALFSSQANASGWLSIAKSNFSFNKPANIGKWVCFEMEVLLNTPGSSDGLYRIWADDSLIIERTKIDLRGSENIMINEVMLDCYWNSGSPKSQNRYYDNFVISTKRIGPVNNKTKASDDGSAEKKRSSKNKPVLQRHLRYTDHNCRGVYLILNRGTVKQSFTLSGKMELRDSNEDFNVEDR